MEQALIISSILLWLGFLLNFILILALIRRIKHLNGDSNYLETLKPGMVAPPFQAKSLVDGNTVNQKSYDGKKILFIVIGTSCSPCRDFIPYILELIPLAKQHDVELILVSDSDERSTEAYLEEFNIGVPTLIAQKSNSNFLKNYKVSVTPWYCLIDSRGNIQGAGYPGMHAEHVRMQILTTKHND